MENNEDMEPGFAKELKKFASYATLIIGALAWLDNRYMGSHKELLATMEIHHNEVVALEKDVIKLDKDVEYIRVDLDKLLAVTPKPSNEQVPSNDRKDIAYLFVPPSMLESKDKSKSQHYITSK